jgi:hypothetical protein
MTSLRKQLALSLIVASILIAIASTPACRRPESSRGTVLEISARDMWVDTGLDVTNKSVQIKYDSGKWSNDGVESHFCDGEGFIPEAQDFRDVIPKLLVPNAPLGALVGRTNGEPFFVGNLYVEHPGSGHLFLSINDKPESFDDNAGSLRIVVTLLD